MKHQITGDPFVDAGGLAAEAVFEHLKLEEANNENWLKAIEWAAEIYVNKWNANLFSVFHGAKISHPSVPLNEKTKLTVEQFKQIFTESPAILESYCRACGKKSKLSGMGRDIIPLSGSGAFLNFHHAHETGLFLCPNCLATLFMFPFAVLQCGNIVFLQTQTNSIRKFWKERTVERNFSTIARGSSKGILKSDITNPQNAFLVIVNEIIEKLYEEHRTFEAQDLRLFYFTNFAAKPESAIFDLPANVFTFLWIVNNPRWPDIKFAWHAFVRRFFLIKKAEFNEESKSWQSTKNKDRDQLNDDDYKNNPNKIYQNLLAGKNILRSMYRVKEKKNLIPIEIPKAYCKEVRHMKKDRIQAVLDLADRVCEIVEKQDARKLIYPIESARFVYQFRTALIRLLKKNIALGEPQPLFTTEDYLEKLLPDGEPWSDVRDLMLIRIYEKLHHYLQNAGEKLDEEAVLVPDENDEL